MSWNNGGNSGGGSGGGSGGNPGGPWGNPEGNPPPGGKGPSRGPWGSGNGRRGGGGGNGPNLPDLDEVIQRLQQQARRFVPGGRGGRGGNARLVGVMALAAVAIWLASGFYRVQPDEQGVVLRFGAFQGYTYPGLRYHLPWPIESALTPSVTRVNRIEVGVRSPGDRFDRSGETGREVPAEALMLTGDENIIDINFSVFWRIKDARDFLFNTRNPADTVRAASESMMRQVLGRTPIQPALTEARARIEEDVKTGSQSILDQYGSGVEVTQVQLQKVDPPAAVIESFRDVQRANTDAERVRNEAESYRNDIVPRARGEAARLIAEAEGQKRASVAEATGQTQRFLSVYAAYKVAKDITLQRLYIDTMQQILSTTPSIVLDDRLKGIVPYLPLDNATMARPTTQAAPPPLAAPAPAGAQQ